MNTEQEMRMRGHDKFDESFYVQKDDERFLVKMDHGTVEREKRTRPSTTHE